MNSEYQTPPPYPDPLKKAYHLSTDGEGKIKITHSYKI